MIINGDHLVSLVDHYSITFELYLSKHNWWTEYWIIIIEVSNIGKYIVVINCAPAAGLSSE